LSIAVPVLGRKGIEGQQKFGDGGVTRKAIPTLLREFSKKAVLRPM
jgi:hypothetical protein